MNHQKSTEKRRQRRRGRVRRKIEGTTTRPRLTIFRSSKHIYAQLIDDETGATLAAASSNHPDIRATTPYGGNVKAASAVGTKLAEAAKAKGITLAAFDRGHYKFHGRVKALAEAANAAGLKCSESRPVKNPPAEAPAAVAPAPKAEKPAKEPKAPKSI